jgi:hypothetical protein
MACEHASLGLVGRRSDSSPTDSPSDSATGWASSRLQPRVGSAAGSTTAPDYPCLSEAATISGPTPPWFVTACGHMGNGRASARRRPSPRPHRPTGVTHPRLFGHADVLAASHGEQRPDRRRARDRYRGGALVRSSAVGAIERSPTRSRDARRRGEQKQLRHGRAHRRAIGSRVAWPAERGPRDPPRSGWACI